MSFAVLEHQHTKLKPATVIWMTQADTQPTRPAHLLLRSMGQMRGGWTCRVSAMGQIKNIRKNKNTLFLALWVCIRSKLQLHCQTSWISYPDFTGGVRMAGKPWSEYETSVEWGAYLVRTALWFWLSHQRPVPEWTWNWESEEQRANSLETFHACLQIFFDKLFSPRQLLPLIMLGYHWFGSFRCTGANVTRWC